jgi:hypothetical protein
MASAPDPGQSMLMPERYPRRNAKTPAITPVTLPTVPTAHIEPADYSSAVLDLIAALAALEYAVAEIGLTDQAGGIRVVLLLA